ncbi:MAG: hypothetical protein KGL02_03345 [Acidobacteriota bacterium]|nr:hypothetical protein [Acidobacteriota bacterium]MDE3171200.1 hypothetical protein [Acidobacteriota bacterium]
MNPADARPERIENDAYSAAPGIDDPQAVLSVLEADQIVAAKQRMHFGRRKLSRGVSILLWGMRVYVVIMMVLLVISAIRGIHSAP